MKTRIKFIAYSGLSIAMALISCQKEEYAVPNPPNRGGTISISSGRLAPTAVVVGTTNGIGEKATRYDYWVGSAPRELNLTYPTMTEAAWRSNLILTYLEATADNIETYYPVPGRGASGEYWMYKNDKRTESNIVFLDSEYRPVMVQDFYDMAKIIEIEPNAETENSSRSQLMEDLYKAGVDITDYHQVAHYFDLEN